MCIATKNHLSNTISPHNLFIYISFGSKNDSEEKCIAEVTPKYELTHTHSDTKKKVSLFVSHSNVLVDMRHDNFILLFRCRIQNTQNSYDIRIYQYDIMFITHRMYGNKFEFTMNLQLCARCFCFFPISYIVDAFAQTLKD